MDRFHAREPDEHGEDIAGRSRSVSEPLTELEIYSRRIEMLEEQLLETRGHLAQARSNNESEPSSTRNCWRKRNSPMSSINDPNPTKTLPIAPKAA